MQETQETQVRSVGQENPLEKKMVAHSNILAWEIPWTEDPGGLQSMGSPRVGHDGVTKEQQWYLQNHTPPPQPLQTKLFLCWYYLVVPVSSLERNLTEQGPYQPNLHCAPIASTVPAYNNSSLNTVLN